jgi:hypothetical protein
LVNSYANWLNRPSLPAGVTEIAAGIALMAIAVVNGLGIKLNTTFTNRCQQNDGHCGNG